MTPQDDAYNSSETLSKVGVLKPCPFCDRTPRLHHGSAGADITYVLCDGCGAVVSFRPHLKGESTILAWNTRTDHAAEVERLEAALARVAALADRWEFGDYEEMEDFDELRAALLPPGAGE